MPQHISDLPAVGSRLRYTRLLLQTLRYGIAWLLAAAALENVHAAAPLPVVASFSILGDWVAEIGNPYVKLSILIAAEKDAHHVEPTPNNARALTQAALIISNGLGFEPWLARLIEASQSRAQWVVSTAGIDPLYETHGGRRYTDPHAWQDPLLARHYIRNIANALANADAAHAGHYQARAAEYDKQLLALDAWARQQFATLAPAQRRAILPHQAFGYLARRYQLKLEAVAKVDSSTAISPQSARRLIQRIRQHKTQALFTDYAANPKLMRQIAEELGVPLGPALFSEQLPLKQGRPLSYLHMFRSNVNRLVAGMRLNPALP